MEALRFIRVPAPSPASEEEVTSAHLFGKVPDLEVAIHMGCSLDPELSDQSGRPRYRNTIMVAKRNAGEKDFISEPLNDQHRAMFPRAVAWWESNQSAQSRVSVSLLPAITPAEVAELRDLNILDMDALADYADIPAELVGWQAMARRFRSLSKPRFRMIDGGMEQVA